MHISKSTISPTKIKISFEASSDELLKAKNATLKKLAPSVKLQGFRTGKVPLNLVEKNLDQQLFQSEVIETVINKLYITALDNENIRPVTNPDINITKFVPFTTLEFNAEITTLGKMKIADYTKIKLSEKPLKIEAKDVDNVITSLRQRAADVKAVDRVAKDGDQVVIDFKGVDSKNQPVAGAEGKEYPLILGSNSFIPGFEKNLIGLKTGDQKTFTIVFPSDYGVKALQNKKVTFEVKVNSVSEVHLPELDDSFAASVGPFTTVIELRDDIKKQIEIEKRRESETIYENELLELIASKSAIEIPDLLIEEQIDRIEAEEKQNLIYRGQTFEEHLKEEGVTPSEHRDQKRPAAEQRVKIGILLSEISEKENIIVTPEETEVRLQILKSQYRDPASIAQLEKPETIRDLNARIITEKTVEKLKQYARSNNK